jgi:signal transduction histidine kinase
MLLAAPVVAAAVLGAALVSVARVAAHSLRERDLAVRQGVLLRLGHELESALREEGPEEAGVTVGRFLAEHRGALLGVEVVGPQGVTARAGTVDSDADTQPALLGPRWRALAGMGGRGGPGRGTMATLRLQPVPALGASDRLAAVLTIGAVAGAAALVAFAVAAMAGLAQRQRLAASEAERRRLEVLALAGAGLAHRVRNPLAGIKGTTQLLLDATPPATAARARRILDAAERIEAVLGRLLEFARPPEASPETVELGETARQVASRAAGTVTVTGAAAVAWADREHVESILEELLANARAADPGGTLEIAVRREGRRAVAEVLDRGTGLAVPAERAFEPYVTTRPEGTGLGLAIVRALAAANGGAVSLAPRAGGGCVARFDLPGGSA